MWPLWRDPMWLSNWPWFLWGSGQLSNVRSYISFLLFVSLLFSPSLLLPWDCNTQESISVQPLIQAPFSKEHRLTFSTRRGPRKQTSGVWFCSWISHPCESNRNLIVGSRWSDNNFALQLASQLVKLSLVVKGRLCRKKKSQPITL